MFIFLHNMQIKEVHAMFYIDFTTPEGKTHRIDVIKNPVTYECPVCGEIHIYKFDPEYENWCWKCAERREEEERKKQTEQSYSYVANFLNQKFKTNYTPEDMKRFTQSPEYQKDPRQACKALIDQLMKNRPKRKKKQADAKPNPNVICIPNPNYRPEYDPDLRQEYNR